MATVTERMQELKDQGWTVTPPDEDHVHKAEISVTGARTGCQWALELFIRDLDADGEDMSRDEGQVTITRTGGTDPDGNYLDPHSSSSGTMPGDIAMTYALGYLQRSMAN